jgi:hypothetical protein
LPYATHQNDTHGPSRLVGLAHLLAGAPFADRLQIRPHVFGFRQAPQTARNALPEVSRDQLDPTINRAEGQTFQRALADLNRATLAKQLAFAFNPSVARIRYTIFYG